MPPRLSVVVPFYGVEDYIGACLESIRAQTLRDIEVILVDDGSKDRSAEIAQAMVDRDERFRIVAQDNQGLGPARNTGTKEATGEYLTFVDSDDLLTVHGLTSLVDTLDRSGSSLAAGNAKRFNKSSGVRQSWSHRRAFAETYIATHVTELPVLARDRMVWNKVYRRSFWDDMGLEFPAIRYEDYPVTLKAHIEAVTVDVLSQPVYYWRERESGDSITQLAYRYDNLHDRVVSAEMVLDDLEAGPARDFAAVRQEVVDALAETDMVTIYQAFATVPDSEADALLALGHRLAKRLRPSGPERRHPFNRIQQSALDAGDVPLLRDLALYRGGGGLTGWARAHRSPRRPWRMEFPYPGLGSPSVPRRLYAVPRKQVGLRTSVSSVRWSDEGLHVRGTAEIRHVVTTDESTVELWFGSSGRWHSLPVSRFTTLDSHGEATPSGFEVTVTPEVLRAARGRSRHGSFRVRVRTGRYTREAALRGALEGSSKWPDGAWLDEHVRAQPTSTSRGEFVVTWLVDAPRLVRCGFDESGSAIGMVLEVARTVERAELIIDANDLATELVVDCTCEPGPGVTTLRVSAPTSALLDAVEHDDPYLQMNSRAVRIRLDGDDDPQLAIWDAESSSAVLVRHAKLLRLTRSPAGRVNIVEGPVRLLAEWIRLDEVPTGTHLVVGGRLPSAAAHTDGVAREDVVWRRFLPDGDDHVDARGELAWEDGAWSLSTAVDSLLAIPAEDHRVGLDRAATLADWSLFSVPPAGEAETVVVDPFLNAMLPVVFAGALRRATVRPRANVVHVEIRNKL